jgi:alkylglycerol monooxygenase
MKLNYLALAVPLFMLFIGLEYYYSKRKGKNFFQYAQSVANLNIGIAERLLDIFTTGLFFFIFDYVYKHFAIFDIKINALTWVLLFLATDLVWYWYHRLSHEINVFWAAHVVHHQSEDYNYTVSARITIFQSVIRCVFWCALPLMGFPAIMISTFLLIHGMYAFFIHTQALGRWGWFEKVLVTPTHHSLHHASNPEYLDKNYGDVLIIWDKLFGTFVQKKEDVKIVFGLTKQLNSHSFLWQHFHFPLEMYMNFRKAKGIKAKWRVIFGKPDDLNPKYRSVLERKLLNPHPNRNSKPTLVIRQYITAQTVFSIILLFVVGFFVYYLSLLQIFLLSFFILLSLINSGAILDQRKWIFYLEYIRVILVLVTIGVFYPNNWALSGIMAALLLLIWYFRPIQRFYLRFLFTNSQS